MLGDQKRLLNLYYIIIIIIIFVINPIHGFMHPSIIIIIFTLQWSHGIIGFMV